MLDTNNLIFFRVTGRMKEKGKIYRTFHKDVSPFAERIHKSCMSLSMPRRLIRGFHGDGDKFENDFPAAFLNQGRETRLALCEKRV
jgi:hypothetical protein